MDEAKAFVHRWAAHGDKLNAGFEILNGCFLILAADEAQVKASGCSIDSSVHFMQELGQRLNLDLLNRTVTWYRDEKGTLVATALNEFWSRRKAGLVQDYTPVFNSLAKTIAELKENWEIPFSESWHQQMWN